MPALSNIVERVRSSEDWRSAYRANRVGAKVMADKLPLVHTTSAVDPLLQEPHELCPSHSSPKTLESEQTLGLDRSLYFFVGRILPGPAGGSCFAFDPSRELHHQGAATPFDTGGIAQGHIRSILPDSQSVTLQTFVQGSSFTLQRWRKRLAVYLAAYFGTPQGYLENQPPLRCDPEQIFRLNVDCRSWTWEVRFLEPHSIFDVAAWSSSTEIYEEFGELLADAGPADAPQLEAFQRLALTKGGSPNYRQEMQNWVREYVR